MTAAAAVAMSGAELWVAVLVVAVAVGEQDDEPDGVGGGARVVSFLVPSPLAGVEGALGPGMGLGSGLASGSLSGSSPLLLLWRA